VTPDDVERLVTFHLSQIGDLLFSLPALDALRRRWPEARLTAVMRPALAELVRNSSLVDETLWPGEVSLRGLLRLTGQVRQRRPGLAVCFSQAPFHFLAVRFSGAPVRAGFSGAFLGSVLTHGLPKEGPPSAANNLRLVESLGCEAPRRTYAGMVEPPAEADAAIARRLVELPLTDCRRLVLCAPGVSARRSHREWPRDRFLDLATWLTRTYGATVLFAGATPFVTSADDVPAGVLDWGGTTSLLEAAALLQRARLFVGLDSGMAHLAAAMGAPTVVLFGPTRPEETGPLCGERESVVAPRRDEPDCMARIGLGAVQEAAGRLWARTEGA
jgi:ADP-heptose:LPS heptosyltransferase